MKTSRLMRQMLCLLLILSGFVMGMFACSRENVENEGATVGDQESVIDTQETEVNHVPGQTDTDVEIGTETDTEKETENETQTEATEDPNQGEWDPQN